MAVRCRPAFRDPVKIIPKSVILHYLDAKGVEEAIRLLLAFGVQKFEDHRVELKDWQEFKLTTPYGQLPILEIDGKKFSHVIPICRYLGNKYHLGVITLHEKFEMDERVEFLNVIREKGEAIFYETDEEIRRRKYEEFHKEDCPFILQKLDEIIQKNSGFLALSRLTWADFVFAGMYDYLKKMLAMPDIDDKYPSFKQLQNTILEIPRVKAFIEGETEGQESSPEELSTLEIFKLFE